jgi:hypothetical protein
MDAWLIAAYAAALAAIVQSALLLLQTWEHCRYARSCIRSRGRLRAAGRALVVAPCKGSDVGLLDNLRALLRQDYEDYEVTFVVESEDDEACAVIRWAMAEHAHVATRLIVAGEATESGQKVHNLRAATAELPDAIDFIAFVDSDARPRPEWLRALVARIGGEYGAATGYRWFVPERPTVPNLLLSSINGGLMTLLGRRSHHLIWGGSWAMRRDRFDELGLRQAWRGTLSDDLMASRVMREANLPTRFEPVAIVPSPLDVTWGRLFEFVRRQYVVARFYTPRWWWFGLACVALPNVAWLALCCWLTAAAMGIGPSPSAPLALAAILYGLGAARGAVRQSLVPVYFDDEQARALRPAQLFDILAGPLTGLVHATGMFASMFGCCIVWRGLIYRLLPGGTIHIEGRRATLPDESIVDDRRKAA